MSQVDVFFTEPGEVINAKLQVAQAREQVAKIAAKASLHADSNGPKDPVWRELQEQLACLQTAAAQAIRQVKRNVGQQTYKVVSLENIRNQDQWEVNDAHDTGLQFSPDSLSMKDLFQGLKEIGYLRKHLQPSRYEFAEEEPLRTITIRRRRDGYYLVQLERIP